MSMEGVVNQMDYFTDDASVVMYQNRLIVNLCAQVTLVVKVTSCKTGLGLEV